MHALTRDTPEVDTPASTHVRTLLGWPGRSNANRGLMTGSYCTAM